MKRVLFTLILTASTASFAQAETTTWGQLKGGIATEQARPGLASSATETTDYTSSATNEQVAEIARYFGYRVPVVQGTLDDPATLREAVIVANWRTRTLERMTRDGIGLEEILRAQAGDEGGDVEFSNSEMFELAGHFGYATPDVDDPDNPSSLAEAVEVGAWRSEFENYLAVEAPLANVIRCSDEVRQGQDHPTEA